MCVRVHILADCGGTSGFGGVEVAVVLVEKQRFLWTLLLLIVRVFRARKRLVR